MKFQRLKSNNQKLTRMEATQNERQREHNNCFIIESAIALSILENQEFKSH